MLPSGEGNSVPVKRPRELSPEISFQTNPRPRASIGETWGLVREVGFVNRSGRKPFFEKKPVRQKSKKNSATPPTSPDLKNFYRGSSQPHRTKPAAKRAPSGGEKEKNARQPKWGKARAARSADTTAPRSTVRGKPAYPTVAYPTLKPALVRRRPRRMSIRVKRPSLQPCRRHGKSDDGQDHRRRRAECSVATAARNGVAQRASRSRARVKAAAFKE